MSDSVRPHRRQPTRLPRPWDSPGKNTGVGCHFLLQCMKVKSESEVAQSCPTLCHPVDCSLPGSSIHGILQARILGMPFPPSKYLPDPGLKPCLLHLLHWQVGSLPLASRGKEKVKVKLLSRVRLFATPWTAAYQAPPSMEFSRQEYWSGVPCWRDNQ